MKILKDVIKKIEEFAPSELAAFDYVGLLQGDPDQPISKIGLTLDYSLQAIEYAIDQKCQLLITHHGPTSINYPLSGNNLEKIKLAASASLAVYRCHLSLDFCDDGIINELCNILRIPAKPVTTTYGSRTIRGGVRMIEDYPMTIQQLEDRVRILNHPYMRLAGRKITTFRRIAVTSGKGFIPEFFDQLRPDVYIAGEFEQEAIKYAEDLGIMLVELSHHASEARPLEFVSNTLTKKLELPVIHIEVPDTVQVINV